VLWATFCSSLDYPGRDQYLRFDRWISWPKPATQRDGRILRARWMKSKGSWVRAKHGAQAYAYGTIVHLVAARRTHVVPGLARLFGSASGFGCTKANCKIPRRPQISAYLLKVLQYHNVSPQQQQLRPRNLCKDNESSSTLLSSMIGICVNTSLLISTRSRIWRRILQIAFVHQGSTQ
jgi:hypothetical protein